MGVALRRQVDQPIRAQRCVWRSEASLPQMNQTSPFFPIRPSKQKRLANIKHAYENETTINMTETTKTHVILLSCGSFNPITKGHVHMFGKRFLFLEQSSITPLFSH